MRYLAQRYGTWLWLNTDCEIETDGPEWVLNAYGIMDALTTPTIGGLIAEDGRPVFEEWGTLIHAESGTGPDRRKWTGIVVRSELVGPRWRLKIVEWPAFLNGWPLQATIKGVQVDASYLIERVLLQCNFASGGLNVSVDGATSTLIGSTSSDALVAAKTALSAKQAALRTETKNRSNATAFLQTSSATYAVIVKDARAQVKAQERVIEGLIRTQASQTAINAAMDELNDRNGLLNDALVSYNASKLTGKLLLNTAKDAKTAAQLQVDLAQNTYDAAAAQVALDGGAYVVHALDLPDAYKTIQDLALEGFDWTTRTTYSSGAPNLGIVVHPSGAGATRDDLVFEQGVNILSEFELTRDGEEYANYGIGVGAGEGSGALRRDYSAASSRMRRTVIVEDRSLTRGPQLAAAVRNAIKGRAISPFVEEIVVTDCAQTPLGSWDLGDVVWIVGKTADGLYRVRHQIVSWQLVSESHAVLKLRLPLI